MPENILHVSSAWKGLEMIIEDILDRFDIKRDKCIEFGTEYGYSTVALSNFFREVKGVDIFTGSIHSGVKKDHYFETLNRLAKYKNIRLVQSDFRDYIKKDNEQYDLVHIDIVHTYNETFECGLWAIKHSKCAIFHNTESFPEVRKAVYDLANANGRKLYNYPHYHGLGIIVDEPIKA